MIVQRYQSKSEFLKEPLSKFYGRLIMFESDPTAVIVGDHEFKELSLTKYGDFIAHVIELEDRLAKLTKLQEDCNFRLQQTSQKIEAMRDIEKRRAKITDPKVINTIRYKVTRFAIRLKAAHGVEETLDSIEHAVNQMIEFVRNFCNLSEEKAIYESKDFNVDL